MPYPRNIRLDAETEQRLRSYLDDELLRHYAENTDYREELKSWQRDYWAKSKKERATFPFTGASRLIIPITAISVEAVHARTMTTLFGLPQFVSAKAKSKDLVDVDVAVEKMLDHEILGNSRNYSQIDSGILELEKYGTGIAKCSYEYQLRTAVRDITDQDGNVIESREFDVVTRQGACIDAVPSGRYVMPFAHQDPQTSPWCGEEHQGSPYEVKQLVQSSFFYPEVMEKMEAWVSYSRTGTGTIQTRETETQQEDLEKRAAQWPRLIEWHELWLGWDVDGSGFDKEIVVHYHRQSGTLMSVRYNWYDDLHRPYRKGVYFPVEHRWAGIGICKQAEQFQREITTMHRQRLDAGTIANMPMLKIHKLSGYGPKEPIFPGKMWFVDDMSFIEPFKMSEVNPSAYSNEQASNIYAQQRTGVNEVVLGMPQVGTPGTATSDLARIQEGNKKFDFAFKNVKQWMRELIIDVAVNIRQFGARNVEYYNLVENGDLAQKFFSLPTELIRGNFLIEINPAGQQQNKILDRQNWAQISAGVQQYYTGMLQLAQFTQNPQLIMFVVQKGMLAGTEAMKQFLETFDVRNIERIVMSELQNQGQAALLPGAAANQPGAQNGGGPTEVGTQPGGLSQPQNAGSPEGMDLLNQIMSAIGETGGNGAGRLQ